MNWNVSHAYRQLTFIVTSLKTEKWSHIKFGICRTYINFSMKKNENISALNMGRACAKSLDGGCGFHSDHLAFFRRTLGRRDDPNGDPNGAVLAERQTSGCNVKCCMTFSFQWKFHVYGPQLSIYLSIYRNLILNICQSI